MKVIGFPPDNVTSTTLLEWHLQNKNFSEAEDIVQEMKRNEVCPMIDIYTSLMKVYSASDNVKGIEKTLTEMKQTLNTILGLIY